MNADVYQDTGTGVVGTNMFAYCNNNPVSLIDPNGTNSTARKEQPLGIFEFLIGLLSALLFTAITYNVFQEIAQVMQEMCDTYIPILIANLNTAIANVFSSLEDDIKSVMQKVIEKISNLRRKPFYRKDTEDHHICAKKASNARFAKEALEGVG